MFFAAGEIKVGETLTRGRLGLERHVMIHVIEHAGTVFDTRFVPPSPHGVDRLMLFVVLDGKMTWHAPWSQSFEAPCVFRMGCEDHDGYSGHRRQTFRASGPVFRSVEVRTMVPNHRAPAELAPCSPEVLEQLRRHIDAFCCSTADDATPHATSFLRVLEELKLLPPGTAGSVRQHEDDGMARVWSSLSPLYTRFRLSASVKDIASGIAISPRHAARLLSTLLREFRTVPMPWRQLLVDFRLKTAVQLLSNESLSMREIAEAVGYGQPEALTAAFRKSGLAAPSAIRVQLRE